MTSKRLLYCVFVVFLATILCIGSVAATEGGSTLQEGMISESNGDTLEDVINPQVSISAERDSVIRGSPFTVTINGETECDYAVFVEGYNSKDNIPILIENQQGYVGDNCTTASGLVAGATFKTDGEGKRTIQFNTTRDTDAKTYTVRVEKAGNAENYDLVKINVVKGSVTITVSGDGTYEYNENVVFTGTNTDSGEVYLFITGQNLEPDGISLRHLPTQLAAKNNNQPIQVQDDRTWEYKWNISESGLDSGTYTIYATSRLTNGKSSSASGDAVKLSDAEYNTVPVSFREREVSITIADSKWPHYAGDPIKLRGINTDSNEVYLFITGPNLDPNGVSLNDLKTAAKDNGQPLTVEGDNSWEYTWNTADLGLTAGRYTIYATSKLTNGISDQADGEATALGETKYATTTINFIDAGGIEELTATTSVQTVARGDSVFVRGITTIPTETLKVYIFGPNVFEPYTANVESDGSYELEIKTDSTWPSTQYNVVIEHPMSDGKYDAELLALNSDGQEVSGVIWPDSNYAQWIFTSNEPGENNFIVWGMDKLQGPRAADALIALIDESNGDDSYTTLTFTVESPRITITEPGEQIVGTELTISGTTNLAAGNQLVVRVYSSSMTGEPVCPDETVTVAAGEDTTNTWSATIDTSGLQDGEYSIIVEGVGTDIRQTKNLVLVNSDSGKISITATPKNTYLGETILFHGNNNDSTDVYLFIVGSEIPGNGIVLQSLPDRIDAAQADSPIAVNAGSWEYNWNTDSSGLSPGSYTIYATSRLTNGKSNEANDQAVALADAEYAVSTITLNDPSLKEETDITYEPAYIHPSGNGLYVGEMVLATVKIFIPANSKISRIDLNSDLTGVTYAATLYRDDGQLIAKIPPGKNYIDGFILTDNSCDTTLIITMNGYVPQESASSEISVIGFDVFQQKDTTEILLLHYSSPNQQIISEGSRSITTAAIPSQVTSGGEITISGTTDGNPDKVMLYVFGRGKYLIEPISVSEDGTYAKNIVINNDWPSARYFVLVEHPGENAKIDVVYNEEQGTLSAGDIAFIISGDGRLSGPNAVDALGKMIEETEIDDTYAVTEFQVTGNDPSPEPDIEPSHGDSVTITASETTISLGESITFRGLTSEGKDIYLFMTGPNILSNGILLPNEERPGQIAAGMATSPTASRTDNTWSYLWDTKNCWLDTGTYTIYATDRVTNGTSSIAGNNAAPINEANYASIKITLIDSSLSLTLSPSVVAKGDKIQISGVATGDPNELRMYIFGANFFELYSITVEDGYYEKEIQTGSSWASGQYFVVIHHPKYNNKFDVQIAYEDPNTGKYQSTKPAISGRTVLYIPNQQYLGQDIPAEKVHEAVTTAMGAFIVEGSGRLIGSQAADALTTMIDDANIDDSYAKQSFVVAEPFIAIKNPGTQMVGSVFTITGTTNIAAGNPVIIDVRPMSADPSDKWAEYTGTAANVTVLPGSTQGNTWSVTIDTTGWTPEKYIINAEGVEIDVHGMEEFLLTQITPTNLKIIEGPLSVTSGDTAVYKAFATNAKYYRWYLDDTEISGQNEDTVQITFPESTSEKEVIVKVMASYDGSDYVGPATRTVHVANPSGNLGEIGELTTLPEKPVVGEITTFTIDAVTNAVQYTWAFTGGNTYTTTAPAVQHVLPATEGQTLTLTAYSSTGMNTSKTFTISQIGPKPIITLTPTQCTAKVGESTSFTATGSQGKFTWYLDGDKQDANGNTFTTKTWDYADAGTHTISVTVKNDYGTATAIGSVTVDAGDGGRLIKKINGAETLKYGTSEKYHVLVVHSNEPHTIQWYMDGNPVGTNSKFYESDSQLTKGIHILKVVVTKDGNSDSEEMTIMVEEGEKTKSKDPEPKSLPQDRYAVSPMLVINDTIRNPLEYISGIQLNTSDLNEYGAEVYVNLTVLKEDDLPPFTDDMGSKKDTLLAINIEPNGLKNEKDLDNYAILTIRLPKEEIGTDPSLVSFYRYDTGTDKYEWEYLTIQEYPTEENGFYLYTVLTGGMSTFVATYGQIQISPSIPDAPSSPSSPSQPSSSGGNMDKAFRVLYNTNGGTFISPTTDLSYGDRLTKPADPIKSGYTFCGWYTNSACTNAWDFNNTIPGDMTLYAKWIEKAGNESIPPTEQEPDQTYIPITETTAATQTSHSQSPATNTGNTENHPTLTQAPAPIAGLLLGLGTAVFLLRRRK